ncbi:hypothetical protein IEQ34_011890 [Dendrobium chrysotoxum]|uniref:Uncharacterized protein n=1 Tax=Dendrobium chrysotoxum TaxID=161865 RepID=A0AAV7GR00_DENCH|nr:hypothetical protein IEQ34_011890 [Dendrobium chrysotoxum]
MIFNQDHSIVSSYVLKQRIEIKKEDLGEFLHLRTYGTRAHTFSNRSDYDWSEENQVLRGVSTPTHVSRVDSLNKNARIIQHILRTSIIPKAGDRINTTPHLSSITYLIMTGQPIDEVQLILDYIYNLTDIGLASVKRKKNIALRHIVCYILEKKYNMVHPSGPSELPLYFTDAFFRALFVKDGSVDSSDDEPVSASAPAPAPGPTQDFYQNMVQRFERLDQRFDHIEVHLNYFALFGAPPPPPDQGPSDFCIDIDALVIIVVPSNEYLNVDDLSTQMAGKLIFSLDRNLIVEGITSGNFIQFKMQFQDFKLSVDGEEMIDLSAGIRRNVPLVEITLGSGVDSPISEMEAVVTPLPIVSSTEEDNNQKLIMIEELPSHPEIGSSSSTPVISKASKNKMKNYLRRVRKKVVKARKTAEAKALKHDKSEANQKSVAPSTNPFPGGNHFHPSPVAQRREVVETRAQSSIHLLDYYMVRINQARTEQTPVPCLRPLVEGLDPLVVEYALRGTILASSSFLSLKGVNHSLVELRGFRAVHSMIDCPYLVIPRADPQRGKIQVYWTYWFPLTTFLSRMQGVALEYNEKIEAVNQKRKYHQNTAVELDALNTQWRELCQKSIDIQAACANIQNHIDELKRESWTELGCADGACLAAPASCSNLTLYSTKLTRAFMQILKKEIGMFELQWYCFCMLKALASLHKQGVGHRDVKANSKLCFQMQTGVDDNEM